MDARLAPSANRGFRVLAVDFGTTRCKASVISGDGRVLRLCTTENRLYKKGEGVYEQDPRELEESLRKCVRGAAVGTRVDIAVVTGQGSAPVCLDERGRPVAPLISHLDTRALPQRREMMEAFGQLGYVPAKIFPNLLWLKQNDRKRFERVRHVLDVREYVGYLLTGSYSFDGRGLRESDLEKMGPYVGLDAGAFGEEHGYSVPIGEVSRGAQKRIGVRKGVPVMQAPGDTVCAAIGSGISGKGLVCDVAGSTEVVAASVRSDAKVETPFLYLIPHFEEGKAFLFMSPPLGFVFKWFVDAFYPAKSRPGSYALLESEVSRVEVSERNPIFLPTTETEMYGYKIENHVMGLNVSHTRAHLARSVMEGIAMRVRMALDGIRTGGMEVEKVRLSGGGAKSEVWNQLRADVYGVKTELIQTRETSCLGAAMVASVSSGRYRDVSEAELGMVKATRSYAPKESRARSYDSIYASFTRKMGLVLGLGS